MNLLLKQNRGAALGLLGSAGLVALAVVLFYRTEDPMVLMLLASLAVLVAVGSLAVPLARSLRTPVVMLRCRGCQGLSPERASTCAGCGAAL